MVGFSLLVLPAPAASAESAQVGAAVAVAPRAVVRGYVDVVTGGKRQIRVVGWSYDPVRSRAWNSEDIVVDGIMRALPVADLTRTDVDRVMHVTGRHGFDVTLAAGPGRHRVCVVSMPVADTGGAQRLLGCWILAAA